MAVSVILEDTLKEGKEMGLLGFVQKHSKLQGLLMDAKALI